MDDASLVTRIQRITSRSSIEFRAADAELRCVALEAEDGECSVAVCFLPFLGGGSLVTELKRSVTVRYVPASPETLGPVLGPLAGHVSGAGLECCE